MKWSGRAIALIVAMVLTPIVPLSPMLIGLGEDIELPFLLMYYLAAVASEVVAVVVFGIPALFLLDRLRVSGIVPILILGATIGIMTLVGSFLVLPRFAWSVLDGRDLAIASATGALGGLVYWTIAHFLDRRASVLESRGT